MKKFWSFKAAEKGVGELLLYGEIASSSWWGDEVTPKQFKEDMDALGDVSELKIYINSGGGDAFAGQAIHSMIKRHKAHTTAIIDGLAASAASVIAMAADTIIMPSNAMMMIHKAWTIAIGNADDMRKLADDMDKVDESLAVTYVEKTGNTHDQVVEWLAAETWMTAQEALDRGFCDQIEETKNLAASLRGSVLNMNGQVIDLSRYHNAPIQSIASMASRPAPADPAPHTAPNTSTTDDEASQLALELEILALA